MAEKVICRMCLKKQDPNLCKNITPESENDLTSNIPEMLSFCAPEIHIHLVKNPVICDTCISLLQTSYKFKNQCRNSEEKILQYFQEINSKVDLHSLVKLSENKKPTVNNKKETVKVIIENVECTNTSTKTSATQPNDKSTKSDLSCQDCSGCKYKQKDPLLHKVVHTGPFICYKCAKGVNDRQRLCRHLRNHQMRVRCKICQKDFRSKDDLVKHFRTHTGTKPFTCKICSKSFVTQSNLNKHLQLHLGHKDVKCKYCNEMFSTKYNLNIHIQNLHRGKPKCELCGKKFNTNTALIKHLEDDEQCFKEVILKPYKAKKVTNTEPELMHSNKLNTNTSTKTSATQPSNKSIKHISDQPRPIRCKVCQKTFKNLHNLTKHFRTHTGAKPFTCNICSKSFNQQSNLKTHLQQHDRHSDLKCKYCNKVFASKYSLKTHLQRVHGEKPKYGKKFSTKVAFVEHLEDDECFKEVISEPDEVEEITKTEPEIMYPNELTNQCKEENVIINGEEPLFADVDNELM